VEGAGPAAFDLEASRQWSREMTELPRIAWGGKSLYGAKVGILMLETRFPRIPGDMGNAETWPFPVLYKVVPGVSPRRVVCNKAEGLLDEFLAAAGELVRLGADGITTTCGFCRSTSGRYRRMSPCRSRPRA
jgi:hypothetical protein